MGNTYAKVLYIPDWVTFKWCKEQEEHFHIFLTDYAVYHGERIDHIKEEAEVKAYDALQTLKKEGVLYAGSYCGKNVDLQSFIFYVLTDFKIVSQPCGGGGFEDMILNLNSDTHREKLMKLIEKKGN